MKRLFYTLFIFLSLFITTLLPASSTVITGKVQYSSEQAKNSVVENKPPGVDFNLIKSNLTDKNRSSNLKNLLTGYTELTDRTLAFFSDGSYAVNYKDDPLNVFYYENNGTLTHIEKRTSIEYPFNSYKYNTSGELVNMSLRVSKDETFIFNKNGKLIAHWIGTNCYDEDGNIIMTRKIAE